MKTSLKVYYGVFDYIKTKDKQNRVASSEFISFTMVRIYLFYLNLF